jgi:energy-coupling factor transporter transmembrane protein EcfT
MIKCRLWFGTQNDILSHKCNPSIDLILFGFVMFGYFWLRGTIIVMSNFIFVYASLNITLFCTFLNYCHTAKPVRANVEDK